MTCPGSTAGQLVALVFSELRPPHLEAAVDVVWERDWLEAARIRAGVADGWPSPLRCAGARRPAAFLPGCLRAGASTSAVRTRPCPCPRAARECRTPNEQLVFGCLQLQLSYRRRYRNPYLTIATAQDRKSVV